MEGDSALDADSGSAKPVDAALEEPEAIDLGTRDLAVPKAEDVATNVTLHSFVLRGRCMRGDSETPLAGCRVQARREGFATDADTPWAAAQTTAEMVTGVGGVFELIVPKESLREDAGLQLAKSGYVPREARWKRPASGAVIELGDIAMDLAIQVTGKVTHPDGEPVMDVGILFANIAVTGQTKVDPERMLRTRTDNSGRFRLDAPAFFGEWYPRVEGSGAMLEPQMVVLGEAEHPDYNIHITVEKPDPQFSITGQCVDEAGQALSGICLSANGVASQAKGGAVWMALSRFLGEARPARAVKSTCRLPTKRTPMSKCSPAQE